MLVVLCPTFGFVLKVTKGHTLKKMVEFSQICRELQGHISWGFSGLKTVDSQEMHHDSLYLLRCSTHFLMHLAAHPDDTENLHVHYCCQLGLQVVSAELKAS